MGKTLYKNIILHKTSPASEVDEMEGINIFQYLDRINSMTTEVLEEVEKSFEPSRLRRFVEEVQELLQILSIPTNLSTLKSTAEHQRKIEYLAFYDSLTGLSNRQFFETYVKQLIETANAASVFYVVFLDLDGFKQINDTYGHEFGDEVLKQTAKRLKDNLRTQDVIARFGGDEFTLLLQFDEHQSLDYVLTRLISAITEPIYINSLCLTVNASIGVAKYPFSGDTYEALVKKADKAMYMSKSRGNNFYTIHQ